MLLIPIPIDDNPYFPLPPDYFEAKWNEDELRQWRVNACRQWLRKDLSGPAIAKVKVFCYKFFDTYYLHPDPEDDFDPLFYDDKPLPTPQFHYDWIEHISNPENAYNIMVAPRGSAKTTCLKKLCIMELVSRPIWSIVYATSSSENAEGFAEDVKTQCYTNERILADFGPEKEFGGTTKPNRGVGKTGVTFFKLTNGSWMRSVSARSKLRGMRPRKFRLDDPEHDAQASTNMSQVRDYMERLLFKIAMPMVSREGCGIDWCATFVSRRHYAWHAMDTDPLTGRATDSRFDSWNRLFIKAATLNASGVMESVWPRMWPVDAAERTRMGLPKAVKTLEELRSNLGPSAFAAEYMGDPAAAGDDAYFGILSPHLHGWWFEDIDEKLETVPWDSTTRICWERGEKKVSMQLRDFCKHSRLAITADTSYTQKADSDFKVASVLALTTDNELFLLDTFSGQVHESILVQSCFKLADKWHVKSIHPEAVKGAYAFVNALQAIVNTRANDMSGTAWLPKIAPFHPTMSEKTARIATLLPRFELGKIKLPLFRRNLRAFAPYFEQIEGFNPDADSGGLKKDDHIDTIQMWQFVYKGRPTNPYLPPKEEKPFTHEEALAALKKGEEKTADDIPLGHYLDFRLMTASDMEAIRQARKDLDESRELV